MTGYYASDAHMENPGFVAGYTPGQLAGMHYAAMSATKSAAVPSAGWYYRVFENKVVPIIRMFAAT